MRFIILSRNDVAQGRLPAEPFVWLSFHDFDKDPPTSPKGLNVFNCVRRLCLQVDDSIPGPNVSDYETVFNVGHAARVIGLYEAAKDQGINVFVCQCEAGLSRSAGAAAALCVIDGQDDSWIYKTKHPNVHIKSTILEVAR